MSDAHEAPPQPPRPSHSAATFFLVLIATLAVFGYALNPTTPWETDESAKAAQIMQIADKNGYFLGSDVPDFYRLQFLPLYYSASALAYKVIGGPIFTFMNLSSVVIGVVMVLSIAYALRNAFGVHPGWSALVVLTMPLVITTSTYGNEAAWSFGLFCLSLWLLTTRHVGLQYGAAAVMACSTFCRADMVLVLPFWGTWAALFNTTDGSLSRIVRHLFVLGVVFGATVALLWVCLLRTIPSSPISFEWNTNFKLLAAFLVYPFNPSTVLIGAVGGLFVLKAQPRYALAHVFLLIPLVFYFGNLSSPKYIIPMVLFYGIPAAYLLQLSRPLIRAGLVTAILAWTVVGVSPFGVYGPRQASLWFVPTYDGPCPVGGYLDFYRRVREGFYQCQQWEYLELAENGVAAVQGIAPNVRMAGKFPLIALYYAREVRSQADPAAKNDLPAYAKEGDSRFFMVRTGYITLSQFAPDWVDTISGYLEKGQVRSLDPDGNRPFPDVIEVGEQVPVGTNSALGQRILFIANYYGGHPTFRLPEFVKPFKSTSWIPSDQAQNVPSGVEPIYQDDEFTGFDTEIEGSTVFGHLWPAAYFRFQAPLKRL